jgi:hypothetical protein
MRSIVVIIIIIIIIINDPTAHSLLGLVEFFFSSFLIVYTVGRTPWTGDQTAAMPLPTYRTSQTQTSMPQVECQRTTPVFDRTKTVHALDRAATVIRSIHAYFNDSPIYSYLFQVNFVPLFIQERTIKCG